MNNVWDEKLTQELLRIFKVLRIDVKEFRVMERENNVDYYLRVGQNEVMTSMPKKPDWSGRGFVVSHFRNKKLYTMTRINLDIFPTLIYGLYAAEEASLEPVIKAVQVFWDEFFLQVERNINRRLRDAYNKLRYYVYGSVRFEAVEDANKRGFKYDDMFMELVTSSLGNRIYLVSKMDKRSDLIRRWR